MKAMLSTGQDYSASCAGMGRLEYVVESQTSVGAETWLVVRPEPASVSRYKDLGFSLSPGCRVVVEAQSMRPVGVLDSDLPEPPPPCGYNPYFDLPPA
jgi:hypothetical protein